MTVLEDVPSIEPLHTYRFICHEAIHWKGKGWAERGSQLHLTLTYGYLFTL